MTSSSLLPLGSKSLPPLAPPMGRVVRLFFKIWDLRRRRADGQGPLLRRLSGPHGGHGLWIMLFDPGDASTGQGDVAGHVPDAPEALGIGAAGNPVRILLDAAPVAQLDVLHHVQHAGVLFAPAKAANAGGVATSGLEMSQNSI